MKKISVILLVGLLLSGCVTLKQGGSPVSLNDSWALLPFINNTETPYAAERAEAITAALLYTHGIQKLERTVTEAAKGNDHLGLDRGELKQKEAIETAKQKKIRYAIAGTVNEWRYKVGLDGEPVAGFTLQVIELPEEKVVWSGVAGKSGWSRDAVSAVAQQVLDSLIEDLDKAAATTTK